jgi:surfactin synthase thioesterase subunit
MSWDPWHLNEVAHAHAEAQASLEAFVSQNPFACLGASRGASDIAAFEAAAAAGSSPGAAAALTSAAATAAPAASSSSAGEVKDLIKTVDTGGEGSK